MANIGTSAVRIIDSDGDVVTVTSNKLDVNATLVAGAAIDIGDVEITGHATIATYRNRSVGTSAGNLNGGSGAGGVGSDGDSIACKHIDIMANLSNTGIVYIGASGVGATTGIALYPGDVYSCNVGNTNLLYSISTVSGDDLNIVIYR